MAATPPNRLTGTRGGLALVDGLANVVSGQGTSVDRRSYDGYRLNYLDQHSIDSAYRTSWLVRKITDIVPFDMTRAWRSWEVEKKQIGALEEAERRFEIQQKVQRALFLARHYGGGALLLGFGDRDPAAPAPSPGPNALKYVTVLSRLHLGFSELDQDPISPYFGQPKIWQVSSGGRTVDIHPSRIIPFVGQPKPEGAVAAMDGLAGGTFWGDPLLQSLWDATRNVDLSQGAAASLMDEALVDVIGIPDLMDQVGTAEYEQRLMKRLSLAKQSKSSYRALIKDAQEDWAQKTYTFQGMPDVMRVFLMVASGAADVPATRLLGQSPQGMNSTGESDLINYYDMLAAKQKLDLAPKLYRLDEYVMPQGQKLWSFDPLWQMTPMQKADYDYKYAQISEVDSRTNLIPLDALAKGRQNQLIEDGVYPGFEQALEQSEIELAFDPVDPDAEDDPSEPTTDPKTGKSLKDGGHPSGARPF